jgi:hypothetical protein
MYDGKGVKLVKNQLTPNSTGLVLGMAMAVFHFVWGLFVIFGFAQILLDFIYSIHFLNNPFMVASFDFVKWITLIIVTFIVGYIVGYVFSLIWNKIQK